MRAEKGQEKHSVLVSGNHCTGGKWAFRLEMRQEGATDINGFTEQPGSPRASG